MSGSRLLYRQFGADPAKSNDKFTILNFRTDCLRELKKWLAGYLLHSGDPNMLWSPDHGILAYLTNDS